MQTKRYCINCNRRSIDTKDPESQRYHAECEVHPQGGHSGCQCPATTAPGR